LEALKVLDTDVFIDHFRGLATAASQRAVTLLHTHVLAHGLSIPDVLIAALVLEGNYTLVTSNMRHFQFIAG